MFRILSLSSILLLATAAQAEEAAPAAVVVAPDGWTHKLNLGATGSFNHSHSVVGTTDGSTVQFGLILKGASVLKEGQHGWENILTLTETQTRTPQTDSFVKAADELFLQTTYTYHLESYPWIGPFALASGSTQIFSSYNLLSAPTTVLRIRDDGTVKSTDRLAGAHVALAKPFEPLLLKEAVGAFANPYTEKELKLTSKVGVGLQHVVASGGYTVADVSSTPELELRQLQKSTQAGAQAEAEATGEVTTNVTYGAKASIFYPFYTSIDTPGLSGVDLVSLDFSAKLAVRLSKYLSLDYVFSAKRIPLILDEWQIRNGVLLTAGFDLI